MAGISTATPEVRPARAATNSSTPRRQGRYVLGDLLGRGGMAEVFSGYVMGSHGFQKPVAIKRLLPELVNDHVFVKRLIGEAKLLVGMQHGNIVSVLDLAREGDDVFLVMEYVDGPSLRQLLKARGHRLLPLGVASYIVQSAAAGLEFAHARPGGAIIHADISPSNLLLTTSGEVRVADFGIARREGGLVGVVEGKWAYMAPEQARGELLSPRSDVFALGVVLYELITGQHPLGSKISLAERDACPVRITPPREVNPAVPRGLDAICMRALADNARDRYPSMQALIDAIMDERFTNQWREGAADLAQAIRGIMPSAALAQPVVTGVRTVCEHPVTIVTRSLISSSSRQVPEEPPEDVDTLDEPTGEIKVYEPTRVLNAARGSIPPAFDPTMRVDLAPMLAPAPAPLPPALPVSPELGSVPVAHVASFEPPPSRNNRVLVVLGAAAALGIGVAIAIQMAPSPAAVKAAPVASVAAPAAQPVVELAAEPAPQQVAPASAPASVPPAPAAAEIAQPVEAIAPAVPSAAKPRTRAAVAKKAGDALLRVSTYGAVWAVVTVGAEKHEVPDARFKLAPGKHTVRLKNTDLGVVRTCTVSLEAGQTRSLRVEMEEGICDLGR